jgi:hypothetical protein
VCRASLCLLTALPQQESDFAFFKNLPLWDHRCVIAIPPLHQFPFAEKTGSPYNAFQESDSLELPTGYATSCKQATSKSKKESTLMRR